MIDFTRPGRMISGSKSGYRLQYPTHAIYFNANVYTPSKGKIWWGDLDLTLDEIELRRLAAEMNETVYVLRELDGRFAGEKAPEYERAVLVVNPN